MTLDRRSLLRGAGAAIALQGAPRLADAATPIPHTRRSAVEPSLTFFLADASRGGSDDHDGLSPSTPMRTHAALLATLMSGWDLAGKPLTIQHTPGVYDPIKPPGALVGQGGAPTAVTFAGQPDDPDACIIRPGPGDGRAVHTEGSGVQIHVDGFRLDMSSNPGVDMVTVENGTLLVLGAVVFGPGSGAIDCQVCFDARLVVSKPYRIDKRGTVNLNHIQQDPGSYVGNSGNGVWGTLSVTVDGAPAYADAFMRVDRATNFLGATAFLRPGAVVTAIRPGRAAGDRRIALDTVDGVTPGMLAYAPSLPYGTQVVAVDGASGEVTLSAGLQAETAARTPIICGLKAELGGGRRYAITNGGLIQSNTNTGAGPDPAWLPGSTAGIVDDDPGSRYV